MSMRQPRSLDRARFQSIGRTNSFENLDAFVASARRVSEQTPAADGPARLAEAISAHERANKALGLMHLACIAPNPVPKMRRVLVSIVDRARASARGGMAALNQHPSKAAV